jgi:MFS family permease
VQQTGRQTKRPADARALRSWAFAAAVYFVAVLNRSSLGVAGLLAEERFGISPGQLSVFIFLQLGVYAAMQIPTGVLIDRFGPRRLLIMAGTTMGVGQLLFAVAPSYPMALFARALLGCGDAFTYLSVIRIAASNFSPRRYPLLAAVTGMVGTLGSLVATLPFAVLLREVGWTPVFLFASVLGVLTAVGVWFFVDTADAPRFAFAGLAELRRGIASVWQRVRASFALPGTRLGFWLHFTTPGPNYAMALLWGDPYLIKACGFSDSQAGSVLMLSVIAAAAASPLLGLLIGKHPHLRGPIAMGFALLNSVGLLVAFALGEHPPPGYIVALFLVMAIGGPISMFAFAVARDYNHSRVLGTASGVVNGAGFIATIVIALVMGWVLSAMGGTTAHALRWALLVPVTVQLFGLSRLTTWYMRLRAHVLAEQDAGNPVPVPAVRRRWDLSPGG